MADLTAPLSAEERRMAVRLLGKVEDGLTPALAARSEEEART
jgi:hypothetical protein